MKQRCDLIIRPKHNNVVTRRREQRPLLPLYGSARFLVRCNCCAEVAGFPRANRPLARKIPSLPDDTVHRSLVLEIRHERVVRARRGRANVIAWNSDLPAKAHPSVAATSSMCPLLRPAKA